jgi:hypothetical protein
MADIRHWLDMSGVQQALLGYGAAAPVDPFFSSVVALMNPSATDAATTWSDAKANSYTSTSLGSGTTEIETAILGFGGSCCYTALGSSRPFVVADSVNWDILSGGDFTVEAFIRLLDAPGTGNGAAIASRGTASTNNWVLRCINGQLQWVYPGLAGGSFAQAWALNTTYHVMACRSGTQHYIGIDGVVQAPAITNRTTDAAGSLRIGVGAGGTGVEYISHRITKGIARYTSNYTIPTAPFPTA